MHWKILKKENYAISRQGDKAPQYKMAVIDLKIKLPTFEHVLSTILAMNCAKAWFRRRI
jgi:hypothetical protein